LASPGADIGGVLARQQLRHAVEDAVGAPVRARAQARCLEQKSSTRVSNGENPSGEQEARWQWPKRGMEAGREGGRGEGRHRGPRGVARSGGGAG